MSVIDDSVQAGNLAKNLGAWNPRWRKYYDKNDKSKQGVRLKVELFLTYDEVCWLRQKAFTSSQINGVYDSGVNSCVSEIVKNAFRESFKNSVDESIEEYKKRQK